MNGKVRAAGYRVKIARLPVAVASIPKAQVLKETHGVLKAVIDEDSGKILGVMLLCAESHEIVNIVKLVMDMERVHRLAGSDIYSFHNGRSLE